MSNGIGNLLDSFRGRRRHRLGVRGAYGLTPLGKTKVDELSVDGPPWQVMSYLDENGPSSLSEIGSGVHIGDDKVKSVTNKLIRSGYIRKVEQGE